MNEHNSKLWKRLNKIEILVGLISFVILLLTALFSLYNSITKEEKDTFRKSKRRKTSKGWLYSLLRNHVQRS